VDVEVFGQPGEDLELHRRQRRDAEEAEPGGEPARRGRPTVQRGQEALLYPHPVGAPTDRTSSRQRGACQDSPPPRSQSRIQSGR